MVVSLTYWLVSPTQFQDPDFGGLSGGRVVRIAVHPDYQGVTCPCAPQTCCAVTSCSRGAGSLLGQVYLVVRLGSCQGASISRHASAMDLPRAGVG